ncbi:MAG: thioredoxin family protein [Luteolibacter sp.]
MAEVQSTFQLSVGTAAPDFSLPTADGAIRTLSDVRGPRGLLVVFACNHCPYVVHLADVLGQLAEQIFPMGVGTVAINSNDLEKYPQDGPEFMKTFSDDHGWEFPYLLDESQEIAKAYGAACTPDFFLFDGEGKLFYAGQFDETRPKSGQPATGKDLENAIDLLLSGETPPAKPYPSSGCNIKWKE